MPAEEEGWKRPGEWVAAWKYRRQFVVAAPMSLSSRTRLSPEIYLWQARGSMLQGASCGWPAGQMQQPAWLRKLVVAIKTRGIKRLLDHLLYGGFASPKRSMLRTIMGKAGEVDHSEFDSGPVHLPK